ncbi:MAG: hypothetical protein IIU78_02415 [Alistipes sp.]|nr:hypothetical protein [Alistipes sp.]
MKKLLLMFAAVATLFTACNKETECNHEFIEYDHSKDLVGTWTCLTAEYAEALVISADGSVISTGVENGEYWEGVKGNIKTVNNKITITFEDDDNWEGRFEMIAGEAFTIYEENGESFTFRYCANDLSEEILGMWVCTQIPIGKPEDMLIQTFQEDGTLISTGRVPQSDDYISVDQKNYKVIGDLYVIYGEGDLPALPFKFNILSNATELGDVMTVTGFMPTENGVVEAMSSWLRIKQNLDLAGNKYDYIKTFVTNVKGEDKDIPFLNTSFNFAKMDGSIIDKFLKSILFNVEFPDANTIKYSYLLEGQDIVMTAPIEVEGNKMTIKMSANNPVYQDVDVYTFQDQDNTQMHWYMHTTSFEKFFANTSVAVMLGHGQLDANDTEAIANVYKTIADAVESINLSLVMTKTK